MAGSGDRPRVSPSFASRVVRSQPDNFTETLLNLLTMAAGRAPMIPLDEALRPAWLFGNTVHEGCDRGGYYEQAQFGEEYGSPLCIVKLGCWGPVVQIRKKTWALAAALGIRLADAPMSAVFASGARCLDFRTNSCHSWISRPVPFCHRLRSKHMAGLSMRCAVLLWPPSTKSPVGGNGAMVRATKTEARRTP